MLTQKIQCNICSPKGKTDSQVALNQVMQRNTFELTVLKIQIIIWKYLSAKCIKSNIKKIHENYITKYIRKIKNKKDLHQIIHV